jgi:Family of unknown function (DUF5906)
MDITFLQARVPLQKRFDQDGKHSYPPAYEFTSHTLPVTTLKEFHYLITQQAAIGNCLLKGLLSRPLVNESRAGTTNRDQYTQWLCLDADGLTGVHNAHEFLSRLGLAHFSYILQWSSSAFLTLNGEFNTTFSAHIFLKLSEPVSPHRIKLWLKQMNFLAFRDNLHLTASNMALRWGLDITTCQNDKLLYIAPPEVHPPYVDTLGPDHRITYHEGDYDEVPTTIFDLDAIDPEKLHKEELQIINELRMERGLDKKRATAFTLKGTTIEYLPNPSKVNITDIKEERGYVYFNFNGGDSWAYYHPSDNFEYIYNFKGEPTYKTEELIPDYYSYRTKDTGIQKAGGRQAIGFRGMQDGAVYNGFYHPETDEIELFMARRAQDVIIFLAEYNIMVESLPTYRLIHDPHHTGPRINDETKQINLFVKSELERTTYASSEQTPVIDKVLSHVLGEANVKAFINWLSFIVQTKRATGTGWVFHGAQGTGKGILFHRILKPIIGPRNAVQLRTANFEDNYNGFLENCQLINVDEVDIPDSRKDKQIMADLKNYMTEPTVSIRKMYSNVYEVPNRTNWIFSSNKRNPVVVEMTDRRFNIADYQPFPLKISEDEISSIHDELPIFMHHLLVYPVNDLMAQTASITTAKVDMQSLSETSVDEIANALILGNASVLYNYCEDDKEILDLDHKITVQRYNQLIRAVVCDGLDRFTRSDLRVIFEATVGRVPTSPAKFTKYLRHHGLNVGVNRVEGRTERGSIVVEWRDSSEWFAKTQREYGVMKTVPQHPPGTIIETDKYGTPL